MKPKKTTYYKITCGHFPECSWNAVGNWKKGLEAKEVIHQIPPDKILNLDVASG